MLTLLNHESASEEAYGLAHQYSALGTMSCCAECLFRALGAERGAMSQTRTVSHRKFSVLADVEHELHYQCSRLATG